MVLGHDISVGNRTKDVRISDDVSFSTMLLSKPTLKGLKIARFVKPSPIQLHAIPLGKCGFDLLIEAKSGTGKTAVFTVIALEKLDLNGGVQTIILAPTREIAAQIASVITEIGSQYQGLNVAVVMGGLPVKDDIEKLQENVHIIVGSPGRLRHMIQGKHINTSSVRLFVLDEADKLMEKAFLPDINYMFSVLPKQKQVIMSSATYSEEAKTFISKYVRKAQHVHPDSDSVLLGITQTVAIVPYNTNIVKQTKHRYEEVIKILQSKEFKQCLLFCNYQVRVGELHRMLTRDNWPCEQLYGQQDQTDRLDALKTLQEYKCRILVSTDLAARGIDASNVDIVINFEPPQDWQTYLHRIGRAGRYGCYGTAISILSEGTEKTKFINTLALSNIKFNLTHLWYGEPFDLSLTEDTLKTDEASVAFSVNNAPKQNVDKSEEVLWKALTTNSSEHTIKPEIVSFEELCSSFNITNKQSTETVSDPLLSFDANQNKITNNIDKIEFKNVKVEELPIDGLKYWDNPVPLKVNLANDASLANITKITKNVTNGNSAREKAFNEKERYLTVRMEKNNLDEGIEIANPEMLHYEETKPGNSKSDAQNILRKDLGNRSDEIETDSLRQSFMKMGLPTVFGRIKRYSKHNRTKKYSGLKNNKNISSETDIGYIEKTAVDAIFPTAFGNEINRVEPEIDSEHTVIDADATVFKKPNQDSQSDHRYNASSYHHKKITTNNTENDPMNQASVDAGLPTSSGKVTQNVNLRKINTYYQSDDDNESIKIEKSKRQLKPIKIGEIKKDEKNINSSKIFTREKTQECSSSMVVESDQTESSESSYNEKSDSKMRNYNGYARTYNETSHHHRYKNRNNTERNREKKFDAWNKKLQQQTQYIQHALYIKELLEI